MVVLVVGVGYLFIIVNWGLIFVNIFYLVGILVVVGVVVYMVLDFKMWGLLSYMYKSVMWGIIGWFVMLDFIGILKNYIEDL